MINKKVKEKTPMTDEEIKRLGESAGFGVGNIRDAMSDLSKVWISTGALRSMLEWESDDD